MAQEQQDGQEQSLWPPTRRQVLWASGILIFVICSYLFGWKWTGLPKRTLWDWLELLIVPGALAFGVYWLNQRQAARAAAEAARREREREATEEARRRREAQDEALQEYLEQMRQLMLQTDLRSSGEDSEVRTLARSYTMAVLPRLDGERKGSVVRFLYEAGLINKDRLVVDLERADLSGAELDSSSMPNINLRRVDLRGANVNYSNLQSANLQLADLREANLNATHLGGADLRHAFLEGARLSSAYLSEANLREAQGWTEYQLTETPPHYLEGATMPDGQILKSEDNPDRPTLEEWLKSQPGPRGGGGE